MFILFIQNLYIILFEFIYSFYLDLYEHTFGAYMFPYLGLYARLFGACMFFPFGPACFPIWAYVFPPCRPCMHVYLGPVYDADPIWACMLPLFGPMGTYIGGLCTPPVQALYASPMHLCYPRTPMKAYLLLYSIRYQISRFSTLSPIG